MGDIPEMVPSAEERADEIRANIGSGDFGRDDIIKRVTDIFRDGVVAGDKRAVERIVAALRADNGPFEELVAQYIVAAEGMGHNDAPLYCDYDERTQRRYRQIAHQMLGDFADRIESNVAG